MITTTLNKILQANPCQHGWTKLTGQDLPIEQWHGNDDELPLLSILQSNGIYDALWVLANASTTHEYLNYVDWLRDMREYNLAKPEPGCIYLTNHLRVSKEVALREFTKYIC